MFVRKHRKGFQNKPTETTVTTITNNRVTTKKTIAGIIIKIASKYATLVKIIYTNEHIHTNIFLY